MRLKFKYGDKVKVISGFYQGHEGKIDNFKDASMIDGVRQVNYHMYCVIIETKHERVDRYISENALEQLKEV